MSGDIRVPGAPKLSQRDPDVMFQKIVYDGLVGHSFLAQLLRDVRPAERAAAVLYALGVSVIVVGAGAAGLGTAAELRRLGIDAVVLERGDGPAASWRARYDGLHLHTIRSLSGLPGAPIPRSDGRWVSRDAYVRYLERYARDNNVDIQVQTSVTRIDRGDGGWRLETSRGELHADAVVVATGMSNVPFMPDWPGRASFAGRVDPLRPLSQRGSLPRPRRARRRLRELRRRDRDAARRRRRSRVRLSVRTPPQIARRDRASVPAQVLGLVLGQLPVRVGDAVGLALRRLSIPDLTEFGLPRPAVGPATTFRTTRQIPILDVGFVECVRSGRIEIVPAVSELPAGRVILADGSVRAVDAIVAATGFRAGLEPLVGHLGVLDTAGMPIHHREPLSRPLLRRHAGRPRRRSARSRAQRPRGGTGNQ